MGWVRASKAQESLWHRMVNLKSNIKELSTRFMVIWAVVRELLGTTKGLNPKP